MRALWLRTPQCLSLASDQEHQGDSSELVYVKTLLDSHGENISVTSQNGKTEFTFTLPLVR